jgi:hypothetical protein
VVKESRLNFSGELPVTSDARLCVHWPHTCGDASLCCLWAEAISIGDVSFSEEPHSRLSFWGGGQVARQQHSHFLRRPQAILSALSKHIFLGKGYIWTTDDDLQLLFSGGKRMYVQCMCYMKPSCWKWPD